MFSRKNQPLISLIAQGTKIEGNIHFTDKLRVDGEISGDISAQNQSSELVVSEVSKVMGTVRADHVVINGTVVGAVYAAHLLELHAKARIEGDVYYKALEMHKGAVISGRLCPLETVDDKPTLKLAANNQ